MVVDSIKKTGTLDKYINYLDEIVKEDYYFSTDGNKNLSKKIDSISGIDEIFLAKDGLKILKKNVQASNNTSEINLRWMVVNLILENKKNQLNKDQSQDHLEEKDNDETTSVEATTQSKEKDEEDTEENDGESLGGKGGRLKKYSVWEDIKIFFHEKLRNYKLLRPIFFPLEKIIDLIIFIWEKFLDLLDWIGSYLNFESMWDWLDVLADKYKIVKILVVTFGTISHFFAEIMTIISVILRWIKNPVNEFRKLFESRTNKTGGSSDDGATESEDYDIKQ